jgi:flavin-dependent dehydrogenase
MEWQASEVPSGAQLTADLCIVGAGAAGLSMAHHLRNAGLAVILLESDTRCSRRRRIPRPASTASSRRVHRRMAST